MKTKNKIFSMLICIAMMLTLVSIVSFAETTADGNFEYSVADGKVTITKYVGTATEVNIPATIDGKPVTAFGNKAFYQNSTITRVVIPDSVNTLGTNMFEKCIALESVNIPEGVTVLPKRSFYGCTALKSIVIPDSVVEIADSVFANCKTLENVKMSSNVKTVGSRVFAYTNIKDIVLPSTLETVKEDFIFISYSSPVHVWCDQPYEKVKSHFPALNHSYFVDHHLPNAQMTTEVDAGYYGINPQTPSKGVIAFSTTLDNFAEYAAIVGTADIGSQLERIEKFGFCIFKGQNAVEKPTIECKNVSDFCESANGQFYTSVTDIPVADFDSYVCVKPFIKIGTATFWGDLVYTTVNSSTDEEGNVKWLGAN